MEMNATVLRSSPSVIIKLYITNKSKSNRTKQFETISLKLLKKTINLL